MHLRPTSKLGYLSFKDLCQELNKDHLLKWIKTENTLEMLKTLVLHLNIIEKYILEEKL